MALSISLNFSFCQNEKPFSFDQNENNATFTENLKLFQWLKMFHFFIEDNGEKEMRPVNSLLDGTHNSIVNERAPNEVAGSNISDRK